MVAVFVYRVRPGRSAPIALRQVILSPTLAGLPPGLSRQRFHQELEAAAAAWSFPHISCTSLQIVVGEAESRRLVAHDGLNLVVFREPWCHNERCGPARTFPGAAAAMTTAHPGGAGPGAFREADVELNAEHFDWGEEKLGDGAKRHVSLRAVLVHEIGHVLGFEDACAERGHEAHARATPCTVEDRGGVMFASVGTLEPSRKEIAELCRLVPR
jgi:hypothetical protein